MVYGPPAYMTSGPCQRGRELDKDWACEKIFQRPPPPTPSPPVTPRQPWKSIATALMPGPEEGPVSKRPHRKTSPFGLSKAHHTVPSQEHGTIYKDIDVGGYLAFKGHKL